MSWYWDCLGAFRDYTMSNRGMIEFLDLLEALDAVPHGLTEEKEDEDGVEAAFLTPEECQALANRLSSLTPAELAPILGKLLPKWEQDVEEPLKQTPTAPRVRSQEELEKEAADYLYEMEPFIDFLETCAEVDGCKVSM